MFVHTNSALAIEPLLDEARSHWRARRIIEFEAMWARR